MNAPVQALWVVNREEAADSQSWGSKFLSSCLSSQHSLSYIQVKISKASMYKLPSFISDRRLFIHSFFHFTIFTKHEIKLKTIRTHHVHKYKIKFTMLTVSSSISDYNLHSPSGNSDNRYNRSVCTSFILT